MGDVFNIASQTRNCFTLIWSQLKLQMREKIDHPVNTLFINFSVRYGVVGYGVHGSRRVAFESYLKSVLEFKGMVSKLQ